MTLRRRARASCVVQSQAEACGRGLDEAQLRMLKAQVRKCLLAGPLIARSMLWCPNPHPREACTPPKLLPSPHYCSEASQSRQRVPARLWLTL